MGVLFKSSESLQMLQSVGHVILDKTGTVTTGKLSVSEIIPQDEDLAGAERILRLAYHIEMNSEHPTAQAVVRYAQERLRNAGPDLTTEGFPHSVANQDGSGGTAAALQPCLTENFRAVPGRGAQATIDGRTVQIGTDRWLKEMGIGLPETLLIEASQLQRESRTVLWLAEQQQVLGLIALADTLKSSSRDAITELTEMGIESSLLTGDNFAAAESIARQTGIQSVTAEVLPADKTQRVIDKQREFQESQRRRGRVAMVGDGINDAPALAQADVGIAIGTGTDIAVESADVTLIRGDLSTLPQAIRLSRTTLRVIKQNLFWAFAYNVALIPVAAGVLSGFAHLPIYLRELHPIMAALAMVLSDLVIVANALRLRKVALE